MNDAATCFFCVPSLTAGFARSGTAVYREVFNRRDAKTRRLSSGFFLPFVNPRCLCGFYCRGRKKSLTAETLRRGGCHLVSFCPL